MAEWTICVDQEESQTRQEGETVLEGDGQVGGGGGGADGDMRQREPYCPGLKELTLPRYSYVGYKPHTSRHRDMQLWTGLVSKPPEVEVFDHGVREMVELWEDIEKAQCG